MPLSSVTALVRERVVAALGAPVLPLELEISAFDYEAALTKYYTFVPIKVTRTAAITTGSYQYAQPIADLFPSSEHFYVGVLSFAMRGQVNQNRMDEYLIGNNYFANSFPVDKQTLLNTQMDLQTGDPYYEEDFVNEQVRWVCGSVGQLSVIYGLGHGDINRAPRRHVELLSYLVGEVYYERLIAIRKTGQFSGADFTLNVDLLEQARVNAQNRATEILESISLIPATLG